ncbi:MAG TPA: SMP-30/gluconolactonase/LRE family protein [Cellvibrio sp.]|nr:SMP-30/gluconolactonase/LRE family protein [Cellvibrio sp.]
MLSKISKFNLNLMAAVSLSLLGSSGAYAQNNVSTAIDGVLAANSKVEFIKEGFDGTEGPLGLPDGSFLFTETRANRIIRIAEDNSISTYLENSNGSNGLALAKNGDLISVQVLKTKVGVVSPAGREKVFTDNYQGTSYQRPNDLVLDKSGGIYFTDSGVAPKDASEPAARPALYYISAKGQVTQLANDIGRPNGIQLSRDEKTLYVANTVGEYVLSYPVLSEGKLGARKDFAKLEGIEQTPTGISSGADGLAIDNEGRLYVASNLGVQVFSDQGKTLGIIPVPHKPQNIAFAGKDKKTLYIVGRGAAYKVALLTPGFKGRAK